MSNQSEIIEAVKNHVTGVLNDQLGEDITYHNAEHTHDVVSAVLEIGNAHNISNEEKEILEIAAWFHDVGYCKGISDHETKGAEMATQFLSTINYPKEKIDRVTGCILATRMPQQPQNLLEEIICDADMIHLARDNYFDKSKLLHQELSATCGLCLSEGKWMEKNFDFIKNHRFFTDYAREKYFIKKTQNLMLVKFLIESQTDQKPEKVKKEKKEKSKNKEKEPSRGIETMFRLTSKNHLDLSSMADNKANIMISINAIILSVIVSVLIRKLEEYPHLLIPTLILTSVCLITIVFSILVTRPNVAQGTFTKEDIEAKRANLLFFGNFHKMNIDTYEWAMKEMMKDGDYLYGNLIKDIYYLGVVLGKKYKLLRTAYTFFMFGFVIAVISFVIAGVFFQTPHPY